MRYLKTFESHQLNLVKFCQTVFSSCDFFKNVEFNTKQDGDQILRFVYNSDFRFNIEYVTYVDENYSYVIRFIQHYEGAPGNGHVIAEKEVWSFADVMEFLNMPGKVVSTDQRWTSVELCFWKNAIELNSTLALECPVEILKQIKPNFGKAKDIGTFD